MDALHKLFNELKYNRLFQVIVACLVVGKIHLLFGGDAAWYVYAGGLIAQQMIAFMALFSYLSYDNLKNKTLSAMLCVFPVIEIGLLFVHDPYGMAFIVLSGLSVMSLMWASFRRYSVESVPLTDEYVYIIAKRPDSIVTFIASIPCMPFGRYSYYVGGAVYHYHHDKFRMTAFANYPMDDVTVIKTNIKASDGVAEYLSGRINSRWSWWWNNCMTVLIRLRNVQD